MALVTLLTRGRQPIRFGSKACIDRMILTCPSCDSRYSVDLALLLPNGRTVRCANCAHTWAEHPPADIPKSVDDAPVSAAAEAAPTSEPGEEDDAADIGNDSHLKPQLKDDGDVDDDFEVPSIEDMTVEATAKLVAPKGRAKRRLNMGSLIGWSSLLAFLGIVIGGGWFMRDTVMEIWPPSTKLYEIAGLTSGRLYALALNEVTPSQVIEGDVIVIVITGEIINLTEELQAVPRMRGAILDGDAMEIFTWTFDLPEVELSAGATLDFNTRVSNPPEGARGVVVTFVEDE